MHTRFISLLVVVLLGVGAGSAAAATTAPRNTAKPTISGTARQGELLTASNGTWSGTQPMTFAYQWRRCDTNGANCSNISGATSKTYTLTSADVGNRLRVLVRASNSAGSGTATSLPTAVVAGQPPQSLSLHTGRSVVVYGGSVNLFGAVSNAQPGTAVTVTEHQVPSFNGVDVRTVATIQTASDGTFNLDVRPLVHTLYRASAGQTTSDAVSVNVRPRLSLARIGSHRFVLRAMAARSFVGKYGVLQRWNLRRHHWVSVRRVFFTSALGATPPTVNSRAVFPARLGRSRIRVFVPSSQVGPGYLAVASNTRIA